MQPERECDARESERFQALRRVLEANATTEFGREHSFDSIASVEAFQAQVPLRSYEDYVPYIDRVRDGIGGVLTREPILRLHLTSGTSSPSKFIPFTAGLRAEISSAVEPWIHGLLECYPTLKTGPNYFVVSPEPSRLDANDGAVPIGFDRDEDYVPNSLRGWFAESSVVMNREQLAPDAQRLETIAGLLAARELRMLFLWSPVSFLALLEQLQDGADSILEDLERRREFPQARLIELRSLFSTGGVLPERIWPSLEVVSCWTGGWASTFAARLGRSFPRAAIEPKGLFATEGVVSVPQPGTGRDPLLSTAHYVEFVDRDGRVRPLKSLEIDEEAEVALTTSGGLYRYLLGDRVRVTGRTRGLPELEFVGRAAVVSDLCGEKLNGDHVRSAVERLLKVYDAEGSFALLAPQVHGRERGYRLYLSAAIGEVRARALIAELESALAENFHYRLCRNHGQLMALQGALVAATCADRYLRWKAQSARQSTVKHSYLEKGSEWGEVFKGDIVQEVHI